MADLATWIEAHAADLLRAATQTLSENAALQSQAAQTVEAFYDALLRSARSYDPTPLYSILFDWVDARSGRAIEESPSMVPILAQLKKVTGEQILRLAQPKDAGALYIAADHIYSDALVFLASVEAEDLTLTAQAQLRKLEREIEKLNKSKSDFVGVAAHELKTPLTVIEGYAGMVRGSAATHQDSTLQLIADGIETGAARLRDIVEDLVDVSMIELKLLPLRYQQIWLHHLMESLEYAVSASIVERQQVLLIQRETIPTRPIYADPERLLQVILKVVSNAIKYTPDGGEITLSGRLLPGFLDLMVSDTGIGSASSRLTQIFDPFASSENVSLHSSGKVKFKGAGPGLGLPIAKGLIELHGGSIWAQSPGYNEQTCPGSIFHIMIPLREEPPESEYSA